MEKIYLYVPYEMKEDAKKLSCFYDMDNKKWYCYEKNEKALDMFKIRYIDVDYDEKEEAKENGARWCGNNKRWYTYNGNKLI